MSSAARGTVELGIDQSDSRPAHFIIRKKYCLPILVMQTCTRQTTRHTSHLAVQ